MNGWHSILFSHIDFSTLLVVVFKSKIDGTFARPSKRNPVICGYANRPSGRISMQSVEAKPWDVHFIWLLRLFQ